MCVTAAYLVEHFLGENMAERFHLSAETNHFTEVISFDWDAYLVTNTLLAYMQFVSRKQLRIRRTDHQRACWEVGLEFKL